MCYRLYVKVLIKKGVTRVDVVTSNMCYNRMAVTYVFYMLEHLLCATRPSASNMSNRITYILCYCEAQQHVFGHIVAHSCITKTLT